MAHGGSTTELSANVAWHGRPDEVPRLVRSVAAHGTWQMLMDQKTLDHLAFGRTVRRRFVDEEWDAGADALLCWDAQDWSTLLASCVGHQAARCSTPVAADVPHRLAIVVSLLALLVVVSIGGPGYLDTPPGHNIASWQTR
jgi:hypothetical protein